MRKMGWISLVLMMCLMLGAAMPACAATKLEGYTLLVDGEETELSEQGGYLYREGKAVVVPVETIASALGYDVEMGEKQATLTGRESLEAVIRVGSKKTEVSGGAMKKLRVPTAMNDGLMMADIAVFKYIGARYKHYPPAVAKKKGYPGGVLVMDSTGEGRLTLPAREAPEGDKLPYQAEEAAKESDQIVVVAYESGSKATLSYYEKKNGQWYKQFGSTSAYVGKKGMGKTREGDMKTPVGTYNLKQPFGILKDPGTRLGKYVKVTDNHYWCGTSGSKYYNQLVDISKVDYTPTGADEHLIGIKPQYNYCVWIDYNAQGEPGKGSAIFLHCKGSRRNTAGCVAVDQAVMKELLIRLKPGAKIVLY